MHTVCTAARNQVTILGINSLFGKVVSFLLKQSPIANRLVLYDEVDTRVAHDIAEIPTPCKIVVYNGEEQLRCAVRNSDVILIGDKDDCLASEDEAISRKAADIVKYAEAISSIAPNAVVLIAATPVNSLLPLFTEAQIGCGAFDSDRVMGVTSADTMRASTLLARHMGINPEKAYLPVIGGASPDTRIPLFSQSRPTIKASKNELKNLTRIVKMTEDELKRMLCRGEALNKAYATVQLIDSVMSALRGQRNISEIVLSRTCLVPNVDYFSLPVILGPRGIAHRFPLPSLTERETILLDHAAKHIEIDKMKGINALSGECCIPQAPEITEKYSELITCSPNDMVGSLMEKFKFGTDCPEVCEPSVEYKLLSKVKLKLPPEAKPSEVPKRTKFIEPDTPPQDGCCPVMLPCPPIPPIRGLNQIQAKPKCKTRDSQKACKCFFPPVEKSLVPCKLCPSNKPCVDYEGFKMFYEEHRHCCGPVSCALEENNTCLEALPSTNSNDAAHLEALPSTHSKDAAQSASMVLHHTEPAQPTNYSDMTIPSNTSGEMAHKEQPNFSHALMGYTRAEVSQQPPRADVLSSTGSVSGSVPAGQSSEQRLKVQSTKQTSKSTDPNIQHEDPQWAFRCSTALCLDVMAPKQPQHQTSENNTEPGNHKSHTCQKQSEQQTSRTTSASAAPPLGTSSSAQNLKPENHTEQRKRYNYSSGLSLKKPSEAIEEINPLLNETSTKFHCRDETTRPALLSEGSPPAITSSSTMSEAIKSTPQPTDSKTTYNSRSRDENAKRRLYATIKVIDDATSGRKPSTSNSTAELSLSHHFKDEAKSSTDFREKMRTNVNSDSMMSILKERAKAINANIELQRNLQANLKRSRQKKRNLKLGDLVDTINPMKRVPRRLDSRPALGNAYWGLKKLYEDPKRLRSRGKSAGILVSPKANHEEKSLVVVENQKESKKLETRIDKLKARIAEALKRIAYPVDKSSEIKNEEKVAKETETPHRRQSHTLISRPAMRKSTKAKQDFFIEMRKVDPAYRPTTRFYAAKCPTRLLFDDHPKNHSKMITFNNVIENEITGSSSKSEGQTKSWNSLDEKDSMKNQSKSRNGQDEAGESKAEDTNTETATKYQSLELPNLPELLSRDMELNTAPKEVQNNGSICTQHSSAEDAEHWSKNIRAHTIDSNARDDTRLSGPVQGDYIKHFDNQLLPKNVNNILTESIKAAIRECSRNIATPGSLKARRYDARYKMTSPNRLAYSKKPKI